MTRRRLHRLAVELALILMAVGLAMAIWYSETVRWRRIEARLPPGWKLSGELSNFPPKRTVRDELEKVGAHVSWGTLCDQNGREIRFFKYTSLDRYSRSTPSGREFTETQSERLRELEQTYTVIVYKFIMY